MQFSSEIQPDSSSMSLQLPRAPSLSVRPATCGAGVLHCMMDHGWAPAAATKAAERPPQGGPGCRAFHGSKPVRFHRPADAVSPPIGLPELPVPHATLPQLLISLAAAGGLFIELFHFVFLLQG